MSRGVSGAVQTAVGAPHINWFPLVEMALDAGTLYLSGAGHDVTYAGHTYITTNGLGGIEVIRETDAEVAGLAFALSGVFPAVISTVLGSDVQGRAVKLMCAFIDGAGALQVDANVWTGYLDQMTLEDGTPNAAVRVTAEHRLIVWFTPRTVRFSNEDHQSRHPSDRFFEFAAQMTEATFAWPGKEFFKQ